MFKHKKSFIIIKSMMRLFIALLLLWVFVGACNKVRDAFTGGDVHYDYGQIVEGLLNPVEGGECLLNFNKDHKAVDITAECGTSVKAACGGKVSSFGPGLTGDSVFGGTSSGGEEGLRIGDSSVTSGWSKLEDCGEWEDYQILYGCIDFDRSVIGDVVQKGDAVGTVGECENHPTEKKLGCHIHFVLVDGALGGDGGVSACVPVVEDPSDEPEDT